MLNYHLLSGAFFGLLSVLIGAFGAHALRSILEANGRIATFDTGVQYQMFHALALLALGILYQQKAHALLNVTGGLFIAGVLLFSGSLYVLSLSGITKWGAVAPIGGLCFVAGWITLMIYLIKVY